MRHVPLAIRLLILAIVGQTVVAGAQAVPSENYVKRDGSKLSVQLRDTALDQAAAMLERDARIVLRIPPPMMSRKVSVSFENVAIERGMKTFLRSVSLDDHAVLYEPGAQGRIVFLIFEKGSAPPGAAPPPVVARQVGVSAADSAAAPVQEAATIAAADAAAAAVPPPPGASPWGRHPAE